MKRERGFTLMEVVVTMAVFGIFLIIIVILTAEMRQNEQRYPINYMAHPEVVAVMARLRKDIVDTKYYPMSFQGYSQSNKTLLLYTLKQTGFGFREGRDEPGVGRGCGAFVGSVSPPHRAAVPGAPPSPEPGRQKSGWRR